MERGEFRTGGGRVGRRIKEEEEKKKKGEERRI